MLKTVPVTYAAKFNTNINGNAIDLQVASQDRHWHWADIMATPRPPSTKLEGEELIDSLKGLVMACGPSISQADGDLKSAEENIIHMEEKDENFHKWG